MGCAPNTARKWRSRWVAAAAHLALADAPHPGAPATVTAAQLVPILNLACRPPDHLGRPVAAWTPRELADEAVTPGMVATSSPRAVARLLGRGRAPAAPQSLLAHRQGQNCGPRRLRRPPGGQLHRLRRRPDARSPRRPRRRPSRDTPKHTSWLNQIARWCSLLRRRVLKRGTLASTDALRARLRASIASFNQTAHPFKWTYQGRPLRQ